MDQVQSSFFLSQSFLNPFNAETAISIQLPVAVDVDLTVCDLLGRKVRTLVSGQKPAGSYQVSWDGRDDAGREAASGIFVYRLKTGNVVQSKKMLLVR